jgi:uncharacterized protein (DUF1501 family)
MQTGDFPGMNRRHFLRHMAGFSLMALPGLQFIQTLRAAATDLKKKNKSVIIMWMGGGPATIDIWDLKPGTPTGGEFKPIPTSAKGVQISEHMPRTAAQMKHLAVVRSLVTNEGDHNRGHILMHTAYAPNPAVQFPAIGAVASHQVPKDISLPTYIAIGGVGDGPGFLGMNYAPFAVQNPGSPPANIRPPEGLAASPIEQMERVRRRQRLFYELEDSFITGQAPHLPAKERAKFVSPAKAHGDIYKKGFNLVASKEGKVFNLGGEKASLIEEYGGQQSGFGKSCLLARRLVEAGVTAIEVNLGGWDTHQNNFTTLRTQRLPMLDRAMGALVRDLVDRGLWKNTVLLWMGEFGRTPRINQNAGRDHWARCWSVVVGGGAIKGGQVYGATDQDGTSVAKDPCSVGDVFATVYKALGIDPTTQVRDLNGRPYGISGESGKPIAALF